MPDPKTLAELASLIRDDDGALYADEDAARTIAIVMALFEKEQYDWPEWVDRFSDEIAAPGYYRSSEQGAAAAEAALTGDGKRINRNYAKLWLAACEKLLLEKGLVTRAELDAKRVALRAEHAPGHEFAAGDRVTVRDVEPVGHAHLPLYVRGKTGVVERRLGGAAAPADAAAETRQPVYSIRFTAREVWGADASPNDSVNFSIDQAYLRPA